MEFWEYLQQPWLYATLSATYALSIITVIVVILGENRNPVKSLAWVTVLILFPAVGLVLYIFFGRNIKNKRMISRRNRRRLKRVTHRRASASFKPKGLPAESLELIRLAASLAGAPYYKDNSVEFFSDGSEKFKALKRDLLSARHYINMQYYIFENDSLGLEIADILKKKAAEGVKVRVIYDHVGSWHVSSNFFKNLRAAGVEAFPFFKVAFIPLASKVNWRNHRKMVIIDGEKGYIGGMNIANRYVSGGKFPLWRDCHVRLLGPAVASLQYSFARDWNFMRRELIDDEPVADSVDNTSAGNAGIQTVTGGPMSHWNNMEQLFLRAIASAHKRVWIQTPYMLPPESLLRALQTAALAGLDVRVMMPRRSDSVMLGYASRSYISSCLRAGIKIYFFDAGMLHSKVLIIDDDKSSVGSTNFDFRSFEHNFEGNLLIYSDSANSALRDIFMADQQQSTRVLPSVWNRRPRIQRAVESVLRLLSPIL